MPLSCVHKQLSAHELVAGLRRGNAAAITALYEAQGGALLHLATRLTGSTPDAEDLLHDLFVGLPELLGRYHHRDRLDAWLRGVMVRLALGRMRLAQRREITASAQIDTEASSGDPWTAMDLEAAIAALPDSLRAVFVLRQVEGYRHEEIANLLDITSGASRVRHLRALRQLRVTLEPSR